MTEVDVIAVGSGGLELWRFLDTHDVSSARHFVSHPATPCLYDIDFLSRHEIVPPMSAENLPAGHERWGVVRGNQMFVRDAGAFRAALLTPDAFLALPKHRFPHLADDVVWATGLGMDIGEAIRRVLTHETVGYSFSAYLWDDNLRSLVQSGTWSALLREWADDGRKPQ